MPRNMTVEITSSTTRQGSYDVKVYQEGSIWDCDWKFPSLEIAKKFGINVAKNAGCDNPLIKINENTYTYIDIKTSHKFCVKINKPYRQDIVYRNKQGNLSIVAPNNPCTAFTADELANVIVEVTKLCNMSRIWDFEIVVQVL
jgi:hypothetical protein